MRQIIRKWLGIKEVEQVTKAQVEEMLASHFKELRDFVKSSEPSKVVEFKAPTTRVRNFSQFRDKVEQSVYLEK